MSDRYVCQVEIVAGKVVGFAVDSGAPSRQLVVEVHVDGICLQAVIANLPMAALCPRGVEIDPFHGFIVPIEPDVMALACLIEVRLANVGELLASITEPFATADDTVHLAAGALDEVDGMRVAGWLRPASEQGVVEVFVDGEFISSVTANRWAQTNLGSGWTSVARFEFDLPLDYADGKLHEVDVKLASGEALLGSPRHFIAYRSFDLLALRTQAFSGETEIARRLFAKLVPRSVSMLEYGLWAGSFLSPLTQRGDEGASADTTRRAAWVRVGCIETAAVASSWPRIDLAYRENPVAFDDAALQEFVDGVAAGCPAFIFSRQGTTITEPRATRLLDALEDFPNAVAAYGDYEMEVEGWTSPVALPCFDYERFLEQGYCVEALAVRREALSAALQGGASDLYTLVLKLLEAHGDFSGALVHVPGAVACVTIPRWGTHNVLRAAVERHLAVRQGAVEVTAREGPFEPRVHVCRGLAQRSVIVIVPALSQPANSAALQQIAQSLPPYAELLILGRSQGAVASQPQCPSLEKYRYRVDSAFENPAQAINAAVASTSSEYVCWLSPLTLATELGWLDELAARLEEASIAAVGPLVTLETGCIHHAGQVMLETGPASPFADHRVGDESYCDLLAVAQEVAALGDDCVLTRRSDFLAVNGLDSRCFPHGLYTADYCSRLRAAGKRIVFTPHAHVKIAAAASARAPGAVGSLRARWLELFHADPFYNPTLATDRPPWSGLAVPPRSLAGRQVVRPRRLDSANLTGRF